MKIILGNAYYFSPIGKGSRVHIFKHSNYLSLCSKGPSLTIWHQVYHIDDVCKACEREWRRRREK